MKIYGIIAFKYHAWTRSASRRLPHSYVRLPVPVAVEAMRELSLEERDRFDMGFASSARSFFVGVR
jgi:hypothetical protein